MKSLHLILVLFSIASMFTSFGVYDVDATKEDNNGKSMGCEKANPKNNPHCGGAGSGTSSNQFTACDGNEDGLISAQELLDYANAVTGSSYTLDHAKNNWMTVDVDGNGIDTRSELRSLNNIIGDLGFTCS